MSTVAIIIPTIGRFDYLWRTLSYSLLDLLSEQVHLYICYNIRDSNRDEPGFLAKLQAHPHYQYIKYVRLTEYKPIFENWDRCIAFGKGYEYVAFYHDDDLYEPSIIAKQIACFESMPKVGMVFTNTNFIDENDQIIGCRPQFSFRKIKVFSSRSFIRKFFRTRGTKLPICVPSLMLRGRALDKFNTFTNPTEYLHGGDYYAYMKIAMHWDVACLPEALFSYRNHLNKTSNFAGGINNILEQFMMFLFFEQEFHYNFKLIDRLGIYFYTFKDLNSLTLRQPFSFNVKELHQNFSRSNFLSGWDRRSLKFILNYLHLLQYISRIFKSK